MTNQVHRAGWLLLAAALVATSACAREVTTDEFVQEANAICEEHTANIEEAASKVRRNGRPPAPEDFMRLANETIIPETQAQFRELREVEPPEDLRQEYERYLSAGQQAVSQMQQNPVAITDPRNFEEVNRQADEIGLSDACHVGPDIQP